MKNLAGPFLSFLVSAMSAVFADGSFTVVYTGPNIGNSPERARKVCDGSVLDFRVRAAAAAVYPDYVGNYTYINGSGRVNFHPILQNLYTVNGTNRLSAIAQTFRAYGDDYNTMQMNITLEDREDGIYGWVNAMYQIQSGTCEYLYGRNLGNLYGDGVHHVIGGTVGYDWRDIDGTFAKGFSIDHLVLQRAAGPAKTVENTSAVDGDLVVPGDTAYVASGTSALAEGEFAGDITVGGTLTVRDPGELVLSGNLDGMGDVTYEATESRTLTDEDVANDENLFLSASWKTVATGRLLSSVTNITGILCGTRTGGDRTPAGYAHWRNDGISAAVQVYNKISSSWQTGCVVYMRQSGPDIQAYITAHSYNSPYKNGFTESGYRYGDINFETMDSQDMSIPESRVSDGDYTGKGQVGLHSLKLFFTENSTPHYVRLTGNNTMYTGAVTRVTGCADAAIMVDFASSVEYAGLPKCGALEVSGNAHAVLSKVVSGEYIKVSDGGTLYQGTNQCIANAATTALILDNGTFVCGYHGMNKSVKLKNVDSYMYLNHVSFYNGACVRGNRPRMGASRAHGPRWYVGGETPSFATCGMQMLGDKAAESTSVVFEIDDVTGDGEADFTMSGNIVLTYPEGHADYETYRNIYVLKTGPGTFSMNAGYALYMPAVVSDGVWRFGVSSAADASTDFRLEGGDLEVAPGVSLTMGELIPSVPSTVALGEGASVSIASPSAAWPEGGAIDFVVSDFESRRSIRIGENAEGIVGYRGAITVNGRPVMQDADGYLVRAPFRITIR